MDATIAKIDTTRSAREQTSNSTNAGKKNITGINAKGNDAKLTPIKNRATPKRPSDLTILLKLSLAAFNCLFITLTRVNKLFILLLHHLYALYRQYFVPENGVVSN